MKSKRSEKYDLKLAFPSEQVDPPEMPKSQREQELLTVIWNLVVDHVNSHMQVIIKEKCFGCQFDRPSQREHDFCCMMSEREVVEQCLDDCLERLDWKTIQSEFLNSVTLNELELLKYGSMEWLHTTFTWDQRRIDMLSLMLY